MNCTTPQRKPWPSERASMPKPDELLPLPLPVLTTTTPRSIVARAMRAVDQVLLALHALAMAFFRRHCIALACSRACLLRWPSRCAPRSDGSRGRARERRPTKRSATRARWRRAGRACRSSAARARCRRRTACLRMRKVDDEMARRAPVGFASDQIVRTWVRLRAIHASSECSASPTAM